MSVKRFGRRMFLGTLGGGLLAMPWLPSLMRREAFAQAAPPARCLVTFVQGHGGVQPVDFFPDTALLDQTLSINSWEGRAGELLFETKGGKGQVSNVVRGERLTEELAQKITLLMGVDYTPSRVGHNRAAPLGGYAQGLSVGAVVDEWRPTIDALIGHSSAFYDPNAAPSLPVSVLFDDLLTWYHQVPSNRSSAIAQQKGFSSALSMWKTFFQPGGPERDSDRKWVVDRAFESYERLAKGSNAEANRLSSRDRLRLEMHMESLYSVQDKLERAQGCVQAPMEPIDRYPQAGAPVAEWDIIAQIIQSAALCGISRVFTLRLPNGGRYEHVGGQFHEVVAHRAASRLDSDMFNTGEVATAQRRHRDWYQKNFEHSILPVIEALNVEDGSGANMLDESLVWWSSECGSVTHQSFGVPLMLAGGLGGRLKTGRVVDYRNLTGMKIAKGSVSEGVEDFLYKGVPYDQLLGNILQAFDVPLEEYDVYRARETFYANMSSAPSDYASEPVMIGGYGGYNKGGAPRYRFQSRGVEGSWFHEESVRLAADALLPELWDASMFG